MECPHDFCTVHWELEPTNPAQEGNRQTADERLLPSRDGSGVGRIT